MHKIISNIRFIIIARLGRFHLTKGHFNIRLRKSKTQFICKEKSNDRIILFKLFSPCLTLFGAEPINLMYIVH